MRHLGPCRDRRTDRVLPLPLASLVALLLLASTAHADGYNRISEIAIPILVVAFAVGYTALALVPALIIWAGFRLARWRGGFAPTYLSAWLAGEAGIGICVALSKLAPATWRSCDHILTPVLIGGLTLLGGILACWLSGRASRRAAS